MAHEKLKPTYEFTENKIKALKQIVPEAFEDGKINFDTLRECLGDLIEDSDDERFGLIWPGKKEARRLAAIPSKGTLVPVYGEGLKDDGTPDDDGHNDSKNIFIEGENLEVLKILQKSYAGKVKMIYIDPPYNTGNDFVYDDDFTEPLENYLKRTGQIDDEGKALTTNKKSDGRFHSKWLSMMYPRLKLARELLKEDGLIVCSIGENEVHNLKSLFHELFGEEGFLICMCWRTDGNFDNQAKHKQCHEYILLYTKDANNIYFPNAIDPNVPDTSKIYKSEIRNTIIKNGFKNPKSEITLPEDFPCDFEDGIIKSEKIEFPKYSEDIMVKNYRTVNEVKANSGWSSKNLFERFVENNLDVVIDSKGQRTKFILTKNGAVESIKKRENTSHVISVIQNVGSTQSMSAYLKTIDVDFDYPKPIGLISYILKFINSSDSKNIVLDFFAGSGTTGHAVFRNNSSKDTSNLNFVLVQMKEKLKENKSFNSIDELAIYRLKKVLEKEQLICQGKGFKIFLLQQGQLTQKWSGELQELFTEKQDWDKEKLIFEIILTEGFPLDVDLSKVTEQQVNQITKVDSDYYEYKLLICLDDQIKEETIHAIELGEDVFICFDHAISDQNKLRLSDKGLIKTIGKKHGKKFTDKIRSKSGTSS